ncbi:MAG TPA: hypothetical protein VHD56_01845 [Tepidisphaeraceae bacterium]|nr:hypothetical protein [Tepidisphaeraceae bacterium]
MRLNAYYQILLTYLRRLLRSWASLVVAFITLYQVAVAWVGWPMNRVELMMAQLFEVLFVGAMVWIHFREQIVGCRSLARPDYVRPQLAVMGGWMVLLLIGWPWLVEMRSGLSVGVVACLSTAMALTGWWVLSMSPLIYLAGAGVWLWVISGKAEAVLDPFLNGEHLIIAWLICVAAMLSIVITGTWMVRLSEDDRWYHVNLGIGGANLRPRMTGEHRAAAAQPLLLISPKSGSRIFASRGAGILSRAWRWASMTRGNVWGMLLVAGICEGVMRLTSTPGLSGIVVFCLSLSLPPVLLGENWLKQWRYLEVESLRPHGRASFFQELGLAMAINYLEMWLAFAVVLVADALLFGSPMNMKGGWLHIALGGSLAMQIISYGVNVWMMRYRSTGLVLGGMMVVAMPAFILPLIMEHDFLWHETRWLMIAGALAVAGLLLARDGYRRWLVTELG